MIRIRPLNSFLLQCSSRLERLVGTSAEVSKKNVGRVRDILTKKLQQQFQPSYLEVINESHMHSVPAGSESHFKVVIVSSQFSNINLVQRHRQVKKTLSEELNSGIHALSIQAMSPEQWQQSPNVSQSPPCMGGSKKR